MTKLPPGIEAVDAKLAESEKEYIALLRKRMTLLEEKLVAFDSLLRERKSIATEYVRLSELLSLYEGGEAPKARNDYSVSSIAAREFEDESVWPVWKACQEILRRERREMFTGELVTELKAGGRKLSDKTPSSQVNASIREMSDVFYMVKHKGKAKWGLVAWKGGQEDK